MTATFLFDGDCGFCSACARFIQRRIPTHATVVAWQFADLAALGVSPAECDEAVRWVAPGERGAGPVAIAGLLRTSTPGWRVLGRLLGSRVALWAAWPGYRWVSRHRDRMPGGTAACALPSSALPSSKVSIR